MKKTVLIAISLLLVFMCSCSSFLDGKVEFYAGEELTPEAIQSMKDAFTSAESTKKPTVPAQTSVQTEPEETPSVPIPETSEEVPDTSNPVETTGEALPEASESPSETVTDTPEATPSAPDTFADTSEDVPEQTEAIDETTGYISENVKVYWTESGTKYHTHRDCGSLKNSLNVKEGSLEQAISEGKESICLKCDKKDNSEKKEE